MDGGEAVQLCRRLTTCTAAVKEPLVVELQPPLETALQWGDVGDGELLPGLDLVLGLERQGLVREHGVGAVGDAGVRHEAEGGEYRLAA